MPATTTINIFGFAMADPHIGQFFNAQFNTSRKTDSPE
jgi:hypothetical protein